MKKFFRGLIITMTIWSISRFIPGIVSTLFPDNNLLKVLLYLFMLPVGWFAACAISKNRHSQCIRINLYIFTFIEILGVFQIISHLIQTATYYTGRFTTDVYGIPYESYPVLYGGIILFEIAYIVLCFILRKETNPKQPSELSSQTEKKQGMCEQEAKQSINELSKENKPYTYSVQQEPKFSKFIQTKRSSYIEAVCHSNTNLYVKLRNSGLYLHQNLPRDVYLLMMNDTSMGMFYKKYIVPNYPSVVCVVLDEKIRELPKDAVIAEPFIPLCKLKTYARNKDGDLILKNQYGDEYCYYNVPLHLYIEMKQSNNVAAFIKNNIQGSFVCEKIK